MPIIRSGCRRCLLTVGSLTITKLLGARIMADSDDTTPLPSVTRRKLLTSTIAVTTVLPVQTAIAAGGRSTLHAAFDPALSLWHEWKAAYLHTATLCSKQQRLETQLANNIGFPQAVVHLPDEDVTLTVFW